MNVQTRIRELIKVLIENMHEKRKMILVLSCLVVFITTYMLILPAFTLDKEEASEQGGIDVPGTEQSAEADEADVTQTESVSEEDADSDAKEEVKTEVTETETPAETDTAKPAEQETKKQETASKAKDKAPSKVTLQNEENDDLVVAVEGEGAGLSEDMSVAVREIDQSDKKQKKEYESLYNDALEAVQKTQKEEGLEKSSDFVFAKFYDISLMNGSDEVEPDSEVDVKISFGKKVQKELKVTDPERVHIVHFAVNKKSGEVTPEVLDADTTDITVKNNKVTEAAFTAESFSVFAVVYTVDFHYDIDGKQYDFSMDGGSCVSLAQLIEKLEICSTDTEDFLADVEDVTFSNPKLAWIGKADNNTTVGELKKENGLEPEYSAELTEEQIEEINAKKVKAGDWALISLKPFDTEESLTVTMKSGEKFVVKVTDAQIMKTVIDAKGDKWKITVTYGEEAQIPDGADLNVKEILPGSKEYTEHLQKTLQKLGITGGEYSFAKFFDIEIIDKNKQKIEPEAAVQVEIAYDDPLNIGKAERLSVIHFADRGTEIISDVTVSDDSQEISYMQDSFSVTGTIVSGQPGNGEQRMVLVKDGTRYYIVNNDATLTEVGYDANSGEVSVTDPMLWTFEVSGNNRHIYFNSEATGFNTNKLTSDYYRRYLDPSSNQAWLQEQSTDENERGYVTVTKDRDWYDSDDGKWYVENHINNPQDRIGPLLDTNLSFSGDMISHDGNYLAIERDANGDPVRLVGGKNSNDPDVAHFLYATASKVPSGLHLDNAVNHIDIAIESDEVTVDIPLAYGDYYDAQGNVIKSVSDDTKLTLTQENVPDDKKDMLKITTHDMKRATISAFDKNGKELNDAFYVTGFSANTGTNVSSPQVRIEGRFLCADLRGTMYEHVDGNRYWYDRNYINAVRSARKNNIVEYNITVVKPVTFNLVDPDVGQLYDADGEPITVTVDCAFSGNFNYWDYGKTAKNSGNECPPVQNNDDWRNGDIPSHDMSGMDFVLSGNADDINSPLVAIEIVKVIRDESGHNIQVSAPVTNKFYIYQNKDADRNGVAGLNVDSYQVEPGEEIYRGYNELHSRNIKVGEQGSAILYDYNITDGMYYITEDKESVPDNLTDKNGNGYTYSKTYIETEYVRRGDEYDDKEQYPDPMHVSAEYTKDSAEYKSIPEVVGKFTTLKGETKKEAFLVFYVYNIYKPLKGDITLKKVDKDDLDKENPDLLTGASFTISKYSDANYRGKDTTWGDSGSKTLSDDKNQDGTYTLNGTFIFEELPPGYYEIEETRLPDGHIKLSGNPRFKIEENADHELEITLITNPDNLLKLENNTLTIRVGNEPGVALPHTGGIGTTIFYVLGSILAIGSAVILISRRRIRKI